MDSTQISTLWSNLRVPTYWKHSKFWRVSWQKKGSTWKMQCLQRFKNPSGNRMIKKRTQSILNLLGRQKNRKNGKLETKANNIPSNIPISGNCIMQKKNSNTHPTISSATSNIWANRIIQKKIFQKKNPKNTNTKLFTSQVRGKWDLTLLI